MTRHKYNGEGTEIAEIVLYPETSNEEDMISNILSNLDSLYQETYGSCWEWDGNTECWAGYALYWDDTFSNQYTNWSDAGVYHDDLDSENFDDEQTIHMGLLNDPDDGVSCGGSWGRSPYCDGKKPQPYVNMTCQSNAADAAQTAGMEANHCLINSNNSDVQELTNSGDNQHSLGKFVDCGWGCNKCTPMICGYGNLSGEGNCNGNGSGTKDPRLDFTNCTNYAVAVCEGYC